MGIFGPKNREFGVIGNLSKGSVHISKGFYPLVTSCYTSYRDADSYRSDINIAFID